MKDKWYTFNIVPSAYSYNPRTGSVVITGGYSIGMQFNVSRIDGKWRKSNNLEEDIMPLAASHLEACYNEYLTDLILE